MNGKPVTSRALRLAALHCTHPGLDGADKAILACLVENGDHGTGENCRPGNRNLMDAVRLTKRPLDARIDRLIAAGLIDRTERGDGRGRASVYRILWCSNHYPDLTPNGEWLINKPGCVDSPDCKKEPGCVDSHDSPVTGLADRETGLFAESKPGCAPGETGLSGQPHTISAPESKAHTEPHTPASKLEKSAGEAGGGSFGESSSPKTQQERWVELIKNADLPESMKFAQPTKDERDIILAQREAIVVSDQMIKNGYTKDLYFGQAVSDWEEQQSPPISKLAYGRWKRWLETGDPNS